MNKISSDVFFTSLFALLAVLFNFWLIKEAEFYLSATMLGTFMLIRRLAPTFANLVQLGSSQALIRFSSLNKDDDEKIRGYFFVALLIWLLVGFILVACYLFFHEQIGKLLLPNVQDRRYFLLITFLYISILHLSYLILPYFLNLRKIIPYNVINILNSSLVMLLVFFVVTEKSELLQLLEISLTIMAVIQLLLLAYIFLKLRLYQIPKRDWLAKNGSTFFSYGLPRAAMTFLEMFMLTVGSLLVKDDYKVVGSFLIAITLARVILIVLQPLSLLSSIIVGHNKDSNKPTKTLNLLFGGIIYSSTFILLLLYNWIDVLVRFWLEKEETINDVSEVFRILAIGLLPYCIFQGLKGILEIKFFKPVNLYSIAAGTFVHITLFFALEWFYPTIYALAFSLMIGFVFMGLLSVFWSRSELKSISYFKLGQFLLVSMVLFGFNYYFYLGFPSFVGFIMSLCISALVFILFVLFGKIEFIKDVVRTFNLGFLNKIYKN